MNNDHALLNCILQGKNTQLRIMIDLGYTLECCPISDVLHFIVENKSDFELKEDVLRVLEDNSVDINAEDSNRNTVLERAIRYNKSKLAISLIGFNADIHRLDKARDSLLHFAVENDNYDITVLLIEKGICIDKKNLKGITPIFLTIENDSLNIFKALLTAGASIQKNNITEGAVLHDIIEKDATRIFKYAFDEQLISISAKNTRNESLVFLASKYGSNKVLKLLINMGANINDKNIYEQSPLFIACHFNRGKTVEYLINAGADPDIIWRHYHFFDRTKKPDYKKIIYIVARSMNACWFRICIENGVDIYQRDKKGKLLVEHCWQDPEKLLVLHKYGLNPKTVIKNGQTIEEYILSDVRLSAIFLS